MFDATFSWWVSRESGEQYEIAIPDGVVIILGIMALIGGVFALTRRTWRLALAGAILSLPLVPAGTVLGIIAAILLAKSKKEFS